MRPSTRAIPRTESRNNPKNGRPMMSTMSPAESESPVVTHVK